MRLTTLATAAIAAILILAAPAPAFAAVSHQATLTGNVVEVIVDAEALNAGQQASVLIMRVGAKYSAPSTADIVLANEFTVDSAGVITFTATLPSGGLDDYVLAVNVAGATERYLASLDPAGPIPVEPPGSGVGGNTDPADGGAQEGLASAGVNLAVGLLVLLALGLMASGANLYLRRRRLGQEAV